MILTLDDDMTTLPDMILLYELTGINVRGGFICLPVCPVGAVIPSVPEHICSNSLVRKGELATRLSESGSIVVVIREDHDVVGFTLSQQEMVNGLEEHWSDHEFRFNGLEAYAGSGSS